MRARFHSSLVLGACLIVSCSAAEKPELSTTPPPSANSGTATGNTSDINEPRPIVIGGDGSDTVPDEVEDHTFEPPVVTGDYLWSTNPESGRVALIDSRTLSTRVLNAGLEPTFLAPVFDDRFDASAMVLNRGSFDVSLFRLEGDELTAMKIPLYLGVNRLEVSASGRFAVGWSESATDAQDPTDGNQEIALIDLHEETPSARRVSVDLLPHLVRFNDDETELVVVSQSGISILDLGSEAVRFVRLEPGSGKDVSLTADGGHVLVRRLDESRIDIVSLAVDGETVSLPFSAQVTDLDLSPSGRAVAVIRDLSRVIIFTVEEVLLDPMAYRQVDLPSEIIGSAEVTADGQAAVLFTNAVPESRISVLRLDDELSVRTMDVEEAVESVSLSPNGENGVVRGKGIEGSASGVFSLFSLRRALFPRVLGTEAPIFEVAVGDDSAVVTASDPQGVHEAHWIDFSSMSAERLELSSPPLAAGVLSELGRGFVAQSHREGRVTFYEFDTGAAQTLTGFELSAKIVQE